MNFPKIGSFHGLNQCVWVNRIPRVFLMIYKPCKKGVVQQEGWSYNILKKHTRDRDILPSFYLVLLSTRLIDRLDHYHTMDRHVKFAPCFLLLFLEFLLLYPNIRRLCHFFITQFVESLPSCMLNLIRLLKVKTQISAYKRAARWSISIKALLLKPFRLQKIT